MREVVVALLVLGLAVACGLFGSDFGGHCADVGDALCLTMWRSLVLLLFVGCVLG